MPRQPVRVVLVTPEQLRRQRNGRIITNLVIVAVALYALWMIASVISAALPPG